MNTYKFEYIKSIDTLRAFAVLSVMLYHIYPKALPGGFTGVDVFFVISGYVVSSSLYKNYNSNFFKFTLDFYARRIIRLVPVFLVFILFSTLITILFIPSSWLSDTISKTGLASLFGFSNFALVWYNDGYFSPRIEFNPFVHTWSLAVEEQFYVIFPLIFFLWYKFQSSSLKFVSLSVKYLLPILLLISLVYSYYETSANPSHAFYLLFSRFWELALGAFLFKLHISNKLINHSSFTNNLYFIIGFLLITIGFIFSQSSSFPFPWAIAPVLGTVFMIISFVHPSYKDNISLKIIENPIFIYIGKISYSLYLWHWAIYVFFRWTVGLETVTQMVTAVILTFVFAILSYHFVENYFLRNKKIHNISSWKIVLSGVLLLVVTYLGLKQLYLNQTHLSLSVTKDKTIWYPYPYPNSQNIKKDLSNHNIFVLGDSHTGAYSTMLQQLKDEYNINVFQYSSGGCGVADFHSANISKNPSCLDYISNILKQIEEKAKPNDILFLASLRMVRFCDQYAVFPLDDVLNKLHSDEAQKNRDIIIDETSTLIQRFQEKNIHVMIDAPKPTFFAPPFRCSDWFNKSNPICNGTFNLKKDFLEQTRKPVMNALELLQQKYPSIIVWDPFPILCPDDICSAFDENKPLFFDGDHLSAHGNRVLYPSFSKTINKIFEDENKE